MIEFLSSFSNFENTMTKMERRQTCAKVIGAIGIVVIGLADIALLIAKLVGRSSD